VPLRIACKSKIFYTNSELLLQLADTQTFGPLLLYQCAAVKKLSILAKNALWRVNIPEPGQNREMEIASPDNKTLFGIVNTQFETSALNTKVVFCHSTCRGTAAQIPFRQQPAAALHCRAWLCFGEFTSVNSFPETN
jgi:hypothetical protein